MNIKNNLIEKALEDGRLSEDEEALIKKMSEDVEALRKQVHSSFADGIIDNAEKAQIHLTIQNVINGATEVARWDDKITTEELALITVLRQELVNVVRELLF